MKTKKTYAIILMIAVFMTICIAGCSGSSTGREENNETESVVRDEAVSVTDETETSNETASQEKNANILASQIGSKLNEYDRESIVTITFLDSLDTMPEDAWDISENQDGSVMAWVVSTQDDGYYDLYIAGDGGVTACEDSEFLFCEFKQLKEINFNNCFDTSEVTVMGFMFDDCVNLTYLDISSFDTSNVADMSCMFQMCTRLETLVLGNIDTSNVTNMSAMFAYCYKLAELDVSGFDTGNVTSMRRMFFGCTALEELNVSNFDTSNVTTMKEMFQGCSALTTLDVSGFDTSNVVSMESMFQGCSSLQELNIGTWDLTDIDTKNMYLGTLWGED